MKGFIHKKQIIITSMAFLCAIAGYLTYEKKSIEISANAESDTQFSYDIFSEVILPETEQVASALSTECDTEKSVANLNPEGEELGTEILNPGEAVLTGATLDNADYAASIKINREQTRSKNRESLQAIVDNESLSEEERQKAVDALVEMADIAEKESTAESLLIAKGFMNVVVYISEDTCDVVLDMGEVTDAKRAQVEDIVKRKTGVEADKIVITTLNSANN